MSEIEKLMQNAGFVKKQCQDYSCIVCDKLKDCDFYPEFTAEKQLKVLKILAYDDERYVSFGFDYGIWKINCHTEGYDAIRARCESFEEAVALLINEQWLYLTEEEKAEIRNILNEG